APPKADRAELPLAARRVLVELLLAALRDRAGKDVLAALAEIAQLEAGAAIAAPRGDGHGSAVRAALAAGLVTTGAGRGTIHPENVLDIADRQGIADGELARAAPAWDGEARRRIETYRAVAESAPTGAALGAALTQARALFAAGLFFEVHEVLEPIWKASAGTERRILQGVIQAAVARHHLARGRPQSAPTLARSPA